MNTPRALVHLSFSVAVATGLANAESVSPPMRDLDAYRALLDKWSAAMDQLRNDPRLARELKGELPDAWVVVVRDERFTVPTAWIAQKLDAVASSPHLAPHNAAEIRQRLARMRAQAELMAATSAPKTGEARKKLTTILSRREFRAIRGPSPSESLWDHLWDWIADEWARLFRAAQPHPAVRNTLIWVLLAGLGLFLAAWLVRATLGGAAYSTLALSGPVFPSEGWRDWARKALACARNGRYRDAIHMAYWATVQRMEEHELWQMDRARTPRELLTLLPRDHPDHASFAVLTSSFERAWYGGREVSRDDFLSILGELESLGCPLRLQQSNPAIASS